MMPDFNKTNEIATFWRSDPASSCQFGVNGTGTCGKIDTRLTQPRSADVLAAACRRNPAG
jgi:hypothetical protein